MSQMAFQFDTAPVYSGDNFLIGENNRVAHEIIHAWPNWPVPVVILTGAIGVGKTHLLRLWQSHARALQCPVADMKDDFNPTRFALRPVAVDDADQVTGHIGRERALFHLYNLTLQNKQTLLMTATEHPTRWGLLLPDLASRLRAAMIIDVAEPDEQMMRQLYIKLFADRQLVVPQSVIDWLLARLERSAVTAQHVVAALDQAALEMQKPITIFLARKVLGFKDEESDEFRPEKD